MKASNSRTINLIHESNAAGQHRIVVIKGGVPNASRWYEHHTIAVHGKYRATLVGSEALPQGIFTVSPSIFETL